MRAHKEKGNLSYVIDSGASDAEARGPQPDDAVSPWAAVESDRPRPWVTRGRLILSGLLAVALLGVMGYAVSRVVPAGLFGAPSAGAQPSGSPASPSPGAAEPCVNDSVSDLQGQGTLPPYAEIVKACMHAAHGGVRLKLTVAEKIPARMPDPDTSMIIGYELRTPAGQPLHVTLQANQDGWAAYHSDGTSYETISERVTLKDKTIAVTVEDADLKETSGAEWTVETSWTKSSGPESEAAAYAVDSAPDSAAGNPDASGYPPGDPGPTGSGYPPGGLDPPGSAGPGTGVSPHPSGKGVG